jgi:pimeloyl-ACP methyl ester carboxylesterase
MTAVEHHDVLLEGEGGRLFARCWRSEGGEGRAPIVLFHDSLGCVELWRSFPAALARTTGRTVIAYDRLGFGRSDPYHGKLRADFIATEGERSIPILQEAFGFRAFIACGHSVGGGMAAETAARRPAECLALVTIAAQAFVEERTRAGIEVAKRDFADPAHMQRLEKYHGDKALWVVSSWINTWLSPQFADWTLDEALAGVGCPLLAVHGDKDEYGSLAHPRRIAEGRGRSLILEKTGHVPHREREGELALAIGNFLAEADLP